MLEAIIQFIGRTGAAIIGAILAIITEMMKLPVRAVLFVLFVVSVPFFVLLLSIQTGIAAYENFGVIGACVVTLGSAVMYLVVALGVVIQKAEEEIVRSVIIAVSSIFIAPFHGAYNGWNAGLMATINGLGDMFSRHYVDVIDSYRRIWREFAINIPDDDNHAPVDHQPVAVDEDIQPAGDHFSLESMALSARELKALKADYVSQKPLTKAELAQLKLEPTVKMKMDAYTNLQRLITEDCTISFERPNRDNTILLVKQYCKPDIDKPGTKKWLPVPNMAYIFDKDYLAKWVKLNPVNPNGSDPLKRDRTLKLDPVEFPEYYYSVDQGLDKKIDYETRYVFHAYYVTEDESHYNVTIDCGSKELGICQEVIQLTAELRGHLHNLSHIKEEGGDNEFQHSPVTAGKV